MKKKMIGTFDKFIKTHEYIQIPVTLHAHLSYF
jgi:hypothetical protein